MTEPRLSLDITDGVAILRLSRPECGNAIDQEMAQQFFEALQQLATADAGVLILTGSGKMFCAGGDVAQMAAAADRQAFLATLADAMHVALQALRELPVPIVAAVNGTAAGAGLGLVLAADIAVASRDAQFTLAYGSIGLSPDCGVSALLPSMVGVRRAALLALTNQSLSADQALLWGLVTDVCEPSALTERASEIAEQIAARPGTAAGQTARLLRAASSQTYREQLADEAVTIAALGNTVVARDLIDGFVGRSTRAGAVR